MLPVTTSLKRASFIREVDQISEFEGYFERIREAMELAGGDPSLIKEAVGRQLGEMEDLFNEIKAESTR